MSAAEVLAEALRRDGWTCEYHEPEDRGVCGGCDEAHDRTAARQVDALKAAGYLVLSVEDFRQNRVAVVELPKPDCEATTFDAAAQGLGIWEFGEGGRVVAWSDGYMIDENGNALGEVNVVRAWAAALLAACAAVDAVERSETTP